MRRRIAGWIGRFTLWLDYGADRWTARVHRFCNWADKQAERIWSVDELLAKREDCVGLFQFQGNGWSPQPPPTPEKIKAHFYDALRDIHNTRITEGEK